MDDKREARAEGGRRFQREGAIMEKRGIRVYLQIKCSFPTVLLLSLIQEATLLTDEVSTNQPLDKLIPLPLQSLNRIG